MVMPVHTVPDCADIWTARTPYELAQGVQIAESLLMSAENRTLFFTNRSPLANSNAFAKPTEDSIVRVMTKLATTCSQRRQAFAEAAYKQLRCQTPSSVDKVAIKISVAERVRAALDDNKSLRSEPVYVCGGHNARLLADVLQASWIEVPTVPEVWCHLKF